MEKPNSRGREGSWTFKEEGIIPESQREKNGNSHSFPLEDKSNIEEWEQGIADQTTGKRYVNPIIVISVIVALGISFLGYKFYQKVEKQNASREFSALVESVSGKLIKLASNSEGVVNEIKKDWYEAIFSEDKKGDFNLAIMAVHIRRADDISSLRDLSNEISLNIKKMNPPIGKEKDYQRLKEIYLLFNKYADMAISPTGSFQSYSQQDTRLGVEIKSAIKELELMK
jgi:hypothetical protein